MPSVARNAARAGRGVIREDIQALRALSVMLVVVYHLWPALLGGGFVGVDVFFVISGFLVTTHLVDATERDGRVPLGRFWVRRAYRLLPASLVTIVVTTIALLLVVPENRWADQLRQSVASTFYVQNWVLADASGGYRELSDQPSAFQHFWSLGVEEQYYLGLPLVLLVVWIIARRRWRTVFIAMLAAATVASFAWSVLYSPTHPDQAYFVTTTRLWELGAGALLGLLARGRLDRTPRGAAWVGLAAIVTSAVLFSGETLFPGYHAALPVVGALLVLATTRHDALLGTVMRSWPLQRLGDASYSIYLWHWPLVVLVPEAVGHPTGTVGRLVILGASLALGFLSLHLVERPWRARPGAQLQWRDPAAAFVAVLTAVTVMVTLTGFSTLDTRRDEARATADAFRTDAECFGSASLRNQCPSTDVLTPALSLLDADQPIDPQCFVGKGDARLDVCSLGPRAGATFTVAAVGDSHMATLAPVYAYLADRYGWRIDVMGKANCYPRDTRIPGMGDDAEPCSRWGEAAQQRIEGGDYDAVLTLHSEWRWPRSVSTQAALRNTVGGMNRSWTGFQDAGAKVVAIEDFPNFGPRALRCAETDDVAAARDCAIDRDDAFPERPTQQLTVDRTPGTVHVETADLFCRASTCPMVVGGVRVYRDRVHPTRTYVRTFAATLGARLRDAAS